MYYYSSSNYLKEKMLIFERKIERLGSDTVFKEIERKLLNLKNIEDNQRLHYSNIKCFFYPKKDKVIIKNISGISIEGINIFIDMDIMYYLIDILFIMNVYDKKPNKFDNSLMYGTVFDEEYISSETKELTPLLFENHNSNYMKWKKKPFSWLQNAGDDEKAIIIKLDLEKCFYNFRFNIDSFIDEVFVDDRDNIICKLERELYNYYTSIVFNNFLKKEKHTDISILPVGLMSSSIILNYYLYPVDQKLSSYCITYGRYADDFLMLCNYDSSYSEAINTFEVLDKIFPDSFSFKNDVISLNPLNLKINKDKIKIALIDKKNYADLRAIMSDALFPSFADINEAERETPIDVKVMNVGSLRNIIYDDLQSDEQKALFFSKSNDAELINSYPIWRQILSLENGVSFKERIEMAIRNVELGSEDFLSNIDVEEVKNNLLSELKVAFESVGENNEYHSHYFFDVNQEQIFDFLNENENSNSDIDDRFFPLVVSRYEIVSFLQTHRKMEFNSIVLEKTNYIYDKINKLSTNKEYTCTICEEENYIRVSSSNFFNAKSEKVMVAVCNLNINTDNQTDIINYDINRQYLSYYNYIDVKTLIKKASKEKAKYILMPEFAIQFQDLFKIIKLCHKHKLSLVAGLTHYFYSVSGTRYAENMALIYSYPLKLPIIHRKKYIPDEEYSILADNNIIAKQSNNKYIIIEDGELRYSEMTCFEATNIIDRASYKKANIDAIFIPVYNKDTTYFSNIIESFSRDISCYILQANVNDYGDSRITGPMKTIKKDVIKIKGGKNHYCVIGVLEFQEREKRKKIEEELECIKSLYEGDELIEKINEYFGKRKKEKKDNDEPLWKPKSAGN